MKRSLQFLLAVVAFAVTCGLWPPPAQRAAVAQPACYEAAR
jgi:hypothetical protein